MRYGFVDVLFVWAAVIIGKFLFTMLSVHFPDSALGQAASVAL